MHQECFWTQGALRGSDPDPKTKEKAASGLRARPGAAGIPGSEGLLLGREMLGGGGRGGGMTDSERGGWDAGGLRSPEGG